MHGPEDASLFFGRDEAVDALVQANVLPRIQHENPRYANAIAVASAGMGKSALLEHFADRESIAASCKRWNAPQDIIDAYGPNGACIFLAVTFNGATNIKDVPVDPEQLQVPDAELFIRILYE